VPTQPIYLPPINIWPSPGVPTHPIYYPPTIWPDPGVPTHPIAPGGPPPGIWPSPGVPTHPIAPGGPPPGIWPSPGHPEHPIVIPPQPEPGPPPELKEGYWVWSTTTPALYVIADDGADAAHRYAALVGLRVGSYVFVSEDADRHQVDTVDVEEAEPK